MGPVSSKRMFGGWGLFLDGKMFAIIENNTLYFKADKKTKTYYEDRHLTAFSYQRKGKTCYLSYYQAPEEVFESSDAMLHWGKMAFEVALRAR